MAEKRVKLTGQQLVRAIENEKLKMEMLNKRMGSLQAIMQEILGAELAIKEIEKAKKDEKMLVSLGAGVFLDATIQEKGKVFMTLAGNVLKYSTMDEAKKDLGKRRENLNKEIGDVQKELQRTVANLNNLNRAINLAARGQRKQAG